MNRKSLWLMLFSLLCQNVPRYIPRLTPWKRIEVVAAVIRKGGGESITNRSIKESFGTGTLIHSNDAQSEIM